MSNLAFLLMSLYLELPSCSHLGQDEAGSGRKRCLSLSTSPPLEMFLDKVAVDVLPLMTLRAPDRSQELDKGGAFLCFSPSLVDSWHPTLAQAQILAPQAVLFSPWAQRGVGRDITLPASALHPSSEELTVLTRVKALSPHLIMEQQAHAGLPLEHRWAQWTPGVHQGLLVRAVAHQVQEPCFPDISQAHFAV